MKAMKLPILFYTQLIFGGISLVTAFVSERSTMYLVIGVIGGFTLRDAFAHYQIKQWRMIADTWQRLCEIADERRRDLLLDNIERDMRAPLITKRFDA